MVWFLVRSGIRDKTDKWQRIRGHFCAADMTRTDIQAVRRARRGGGALQGHAQAKLNTIWVTLVWRNVAYWQTNLAN